MTTNKMKHNPNVSISYKTPESQRRANTNFNKRLKENNYEEYRERQNRYMRAYRLKLKLKKQQQQRTDEL
tara:strand:+ start:1232 stop:1441 length:210 start_codon:yes stop_codon:yes gene_type:complete